MPNLAEKAKSLRARVAELEKSSKVKSSKVPANCRTAGMEVISEQTFTKLTVRMAQIARLEGDVHGLKDKLENLERCNDVADLQHSELMIDVAC